MSISTLEKSIQQHHDRTRIISKRLRRKIICFEVPDFCIEGTWTYYAILYKKEFNEIKTK
jgi:hypothetical protein